MVKEILSVSLVLFSVIDILGSLPVVVDIKNRVGTLQTLKTTLAAGLLMVTFLLIGDSILHLLGTDVNSFAVAGAIVILLIGLEMVLGIRLFKQDPVRAAIAAASFNCGWKPTATCAGSNQKPR